jgi:8-amino-7-oxononanoate synthase
MTLDDRLRAELARLEAAHLRRARRIAEGPAAGSSGVERVVDGQQLVDFCSNDYLGLAGHPALRAALCHGAERWGVGAGAAHLVSGHTRAHHALEEALAAFTGRPAALLFSTGYMANLGIASALAGRGDLVLEDRLNHASLLDAGLLSGARFARYEHADAVDAARVLASSTAATKLLLTDGAFSMDGDLAPLPELAVTARAHGATLVVDDAHGLGAVGATGRGTLEHHGHGLDDVPVLMGTLGKAFGTFGAFVAGSQTLIEYLVNRARTFVYTTALPPALAEASRVALELAAREGWRRERLAVLIARFRAGCAERGIALQPTSSPHTPIQPVAVGDAARAVALSDALRARGLWVAAIRPPTVPEGTARLRVTLSAAHSEAQLERLLDALAAAGGA